MVGWKAQQGKTHNVDELKKAWSLIGPMNFVYNSLDWN
jgi:hypothetical protein